MRLFSFSCNPGAACCSNGEYESGLSSSGDVSEFSSTPDTSIESISDPPASKRSTLLVSKGKNLSLIMEAGQKYNTPAQSLYFREMACLKTTPKINPQKSSLAGKTPRKQLVMKPIRKNVKKLVKVTNKAAANNQPTNQKQAESRNPCGTDQAQ